jgi:arylesterase/paraoxonase
MIANRPSVFAETYNIKSHEIKFRDQIRNCEDVLLGTSLGLLGMQKTFAILKDGLS